MLIKKNGITKSDIAVGDVIAVPEQVEAHTNEVKLQKEKSQTIVKLTKENTVVKNDIDKVSHSIDSMGKEIKASKDAWKSTITDGATGTKSMSLYFGYKVNTQSNHKTNLQNKKNKLKEKYKNYSDSINTLKNDLQKNK